MPRARTQPRDQELFAATIRALRAFAQRNPQNSFERQVVGELQRSRAKVTAARKLIGNFDRLTPALRKRALGEFDGKAVRRRDPARPIPGRPPGARSIERIVIPSDETLARDPGGVLIDPSNPPGGQTFVYGIDYVGFHCDLEVGDQTDWLVDQSEEVYAVTSAVHIKPDGSNEVRTVKHPIDRLEYGDVDTGETRLGPIARCWQGVDFPVSFTVVAYERDYGDPDKYRDEIDAAVKAGVAAAAWLLGAGAAATAILEALSPVITDAINWLIDTDDDQVDIARTLILDQFFMEKLGRRGRLTHIHRQKMPFGLEDVVFSTPLRSHLESRHSGLGGRWTFGFDLSRNPAFVEDQPIVD